MKRTPHHAGKKSAKSHSPQRLLIFATLITALFISGAFVFEKNVVEEKIEPVVKKYEFEDLTSKNLEKKASVEVPILMYHYIRTVEDKNDRLGISLSTPPEMFEKQMKYLVEQGYTTVSLSDIEAYWEGEKEVPEKPVVLTFDDGYTDFYTHAWPILRANNMKSTVFAVSNFMGKEGYMDSEKIKELDQSGLVEIGCHTMNHKDLTIITRQQAITEIKGCKVAMEYLLGHEVETFAYPSGRLSPAIAQEVKNAGYKLAVITEEGRIHPKKERYVLSRVRIPGTITIEKFQELMN